MKKGSVPKYNGVAGVNGFLGNLDALYAQDQSPSPSSLLVARHIVVPWHDGGRAQVLAELDTWAEFFPDTADRRFALPDGTTVLRTNSASACCVGVDTPTRRRGNQSAAAGTSICARSARPAAGA